jgi:hypothetical protein
VTKCRRRKDENLLFDELNSLAGKRFLSCYKDFLGHDGVKRRGEKKEKI